MNKNTFWELVTELDWSSSQDYHKNKKIILKKLSDEEVNELNNIFSSLRRELQKQIEEYVVEKEMSLGLGDDSFDDLCCEVIGRGQAFYENVMKNPENAVKMAMNYDFHESFSYSIPSIDKHYNDRDLLNISYYKKRMSDMLQDAEEMELEDYNDSIKEMGLEFKKIITLGSEDFSVIIENSERLLEMQKFFRSKGLVNTGYLLENLINDYNRYMLD